MNELMKILNPRHVPYFINFVLVYQLHDYLDFPGKSGNDFDMGVCGLVVFIYFCFVFVSRFRILTENVELKEELQESQDLHGRSEHFG